MSLETSLFGVRAIEIVAGVFATGSATLGLYIGYLALKSFARHNEASMRYLALGLILLTGVTYTFTFIGSMLVHFRVLSLPQQDVFRAVAHAIQFAGLVCIAFALYRRP